MPRGIVTDRRFDWGDDTPPRVPLEDTAFGIREPNAKGAQVPGSVYSKTVCTVELATGEQLCQMECSALHSAFW